MPCPILLSRGRVPRSGEVHTVAADVLSTVIEVEREIQQRLDEEKKKSRERIEHATAEAERELAVEARRLTEAADASLSNARSTSDQEAAAVAEAARREAERIDRISDDTLRNAVRRYLARILPGTRV